MINRNLLNSKLEDALNYLYEQDEKIKPCLSKITDILHSSLEEGSISPQEAFEYFIKLQEQYTNSIALITKIKEIVDFDD